MKVVSTTALGTVVALVLAATAPTAAGASSSTTEAEIQAALETQPDVFMDTASVAEGQIDIVEGAISAPSAGSGDFELRLPVDTLNALDVSSSDSAGTFSVEVRDEGDGAFRSLFHIPDASSPNEFRFEVSDDYELASLEDGGITVWDKNGALAGTIAPPWAVDANGEEVPTNFVIDGNSITQRVQTDSATAFPVVADPFWIPALMVMAHLTRHVITQAAARGVSQALIKKVVQEGVKSAGKKKGTSVFSQGKGKNKIRVVVDNKSGNIITVTKG